MGESFALKTAPNGQLALHFAHIWEWALSQALCGGTGAGSGVGQPANGVTFPQPANRTPQRQGCVCFHRF